MSMTERTGNNVTGVSKDIRRIAIILCYDKDGIIDDYVLYLLHDLNENLTDLVVTVNGKLSPSGRERLQTVTDKIYISQKAIRSWLQTVHGKIPCSIFWGGVSCMNTMKSFC